MEGRLQGKRALIYCGGTGIGLACAEAMAREGVSCSSPAAGPRCCAKRPPGSPPSVGGLRARRCNVLDDVQRVTAAARAFMGGIDTIVVSAGAGGRTSVFDTEPAEFQRIMDLRCGRPFSRSVMQAPISSPPARGR